MATNLRPQKLNDAYHQDLLENQQVPGSVALKKQLNELNVSWEEAKNFANDRKKWNDIISKYCKNIT